MSLTYTEAVVVGALQGVSELFPVSSLGHAVLVPALVGGRWAADLDVSAPESPYLAFIVGLHVATALALLVFYRRDWARILRGLAQSVRTRRVESSDARLGWLLVVATIPVGVTGLLLEHLFRTTLGRPLPAAAFLMVNGVVLLAGERLRARRRRPSPALVAAGDGRPGSDPGLARFGDDDAPDVRLAAMSVKDALIVGGSQSLALLPGISRSGVSMVSGLVQGLSHEDAARFSFLLATPVIAAAGVLKLPDLFGPLGDGVRGPVLVGSVTAFVAALVAVRWLTRWFATRTLTPFAIYCLVVGAASLAVLTAR